VIDPSNLLKCNFSLYLIMVSRNCEPQQLLHILLKTIRLY
jgi:hypothetical protein